jgi:hypothetical protein
VVDKDFDTHAWIDNGIIAIEGCIAIYDKRYQARVAARMMSMEHPNEAPFTVIPVTITQRKEKRK